MKRDRHPGKLLGRDPGSERRKNPGPGQRHAGATDKKPLLDFRAATVHRDRRQVLGPVTFSIRRGENVAIIGPNGSGKSTLIKAVTRECYPFDGAVRVFGQSSWDVFALRSHLGIVSGDWQKAVAQDVSGRDIPGLEAVLSGFFNSVGVWDNHIVTPAMKNKARAVLRFLEAAELADRPLNEMSSGEARRILIARALVHEPDALILDEPTNSLDLKALRTFQGILRKIIRSRKSIVLVTHHLHDVIPEIKRVILLKDGLLFKDGPKDEVLTSENLSGLFEIKVNVIREKNRFHLV